MVFMEEEGKLVADSLNSQPYSKASEWIENFLAGLASANEFKRETGDGFTAKFRIQPVRLPDGGYYCLVLPTTPESTTALHLVGLAKAVRLHRVRQCRNCQKWYFARRETQLYCSARCGHSARISRELITDRRQKQREYMRRYRAQLKAKPNLKIRENKPRREKHQ